MSYPYDAATLAAEGRLATFYNGNSYNAGTNPGGEGAGGHRQNFIPALQDLALVASSVADAASAASTSATNAASSATAAAASSTALSGTSTTSVSIGTGAKSFTTQSGKSFDVGTFVEVISAANPTTHYMSGQVTAYSGTSLTVNVSVSSGSGSRSDWTIYGRSGSPGVTGATGATGAMGETPTTQWNFGNGTSDTDPGNGIFMFNNATLSSVTFAYMDNLDRNSASQTAFLDSWDDSTNVANRGTLFFQQIGSTTYAIYTITGAVVDGTGYRKVPLSFVMSNGSFTNGAAVAVSFIRTGDKGVDGGGAGDTISDISSVTDGRIVLFNGATGKHITNASFGIGASGANIGALSTANTWGGAQSYAAKVDIQQDFAVSGDISPTQITSNQDDYAPTGNATATVFRLSTDASRNITGLANGADGRLVLFLNVGSFNIVLKNLTTSTGSNQFSLGADFTLGAGMGVWLYYDATSTKWRGITPNKIGTTVQAWDADLDTLSSLGNWKVVYSDGSSAITALALGADKTIFASNGTANAPSFRTAANLGILEFGVSATITVGYKVTPNSLGNITSFTVDPALGNYQWGINHGAATWTAPASDCAVDIMTINDGSAGTITYTGFSVGSSTGDTYSTSDKATATVTCTSATPGVVTWTGHTLNNNDPVYLTSTGSVPTGFTSGTVYYVNNKATNTFELSATPGGSSIATSSTGSGTITAHACSRFVISIRRLNGTSTYVIKALQ
jgi:hypothetical protein